MKFRPPGSPALTGKVSISAIQGVLSRKLAIGGRSSKSNYLCYQSPGCTSPCRIYSKLLESNHLIGKPSPHPAEIPKPRACDHVFYALLHKPPPAAFS